jgi:plastocyanin
MRIRRPDVHMFLAAPLVLMLITALVSGLGPRPAAADDDTGASHPAHIHTGTCDAPGEVVAPLSNVSGQYLVDGTASAGATAVGAASALPVEVSETTVPLPLANIIGAPHVLMVHESDEAIQNFIACGDVGGPMLGASDLPFGIGSLNDSEYAGSGWLHDNGDGTTTVRVVLLYHESEDDDEGGDDEEGESEDEDGDDSAAVAPAASAVTIEGFAFNPQTIEIAVGDSVTWTNNDSAPHTVTQNPSGSGFQSGRIDQGMSFSFTFDTAGTYEYFCEFHSSMSGTVVVN